MDKQSDMSLGVMFLVSSIIRIILLCVIVFGIVKGCNYITSGNAAKDLRGVIETNQQAWDDAAPSKGEKR